MDKLESMAVFIDIISTGSLVATAEKRGLSPSMVAKHLNFLEDYFGTRLIQRTTRKQRITESGEICLERCRDILKYIEKTSEDITKFSKGPSGLLRLSSPISFGVTQLSPALSKFLDMYPNIRVDLKLTDAPIDPIAHDVDVAFRIGPLSDSELVAKKLSPYQMVVCASAEYLKRKGIPKHPLDLKDHDCLGHTRWGLRHAWHFQGAAGQVNVPLDYRIRIDHGPALRQAAISGAGIIMQPKILVKDDIKSGLLTPLLTEYKITPRPFYLVHVKDRKQSPKVRAFIDFAIKVLQ